MFKHQDFEILSLQIKQIMSIFHPLEIVGRGSETQHQVGENLIFNCSALRVTTLILVIIDVMPNISSPRS